MADKPNSPGLLVTTLAWCGLMVIAGASTGLAIAIAVHIVRWLT